MTSEFVWLLIGWVTSVPLVWVGFVAYQWWVGRVRRVELDDRWQSLRRLNAEDELLMEHLRRANREGLL